MFIFWCLQQINKLSLNLHLFLLSHDEPAPYLERSDQLKAHEVRVERQTGLEGGQRVDDAFT